MDKALRDKGLANRKAVLGEDYVDKSMASADSFNGPFQEILNEYCWGMIWSDERLPRKTRSMLNLVMLACLNRMHEWELHLKGALTNGVSQGRDPGHHPPDRRLCRRAARRRVLPHRPQGVRRARQGRLRLPVIPDAMLASRSGTSRLPLTADPGQPRLRHGFRDDG